MVVEFIIPGRNSVFPPSGWGQKASWCEFILCPVCCEWPSSGRSSVHCGNVGSLIIWGCFSPCPRRKVNLLQVSGGLFYCTIEERIGSRKLWRQGFWLVEKKFFFFCIYFNISTAYMDRAYLNIWVCFIHFVISHCSNNIQLMLSFFNQTVCSLDFFPECFDLFICFACEWLYPVSKMY